MLQNVTFVERTHCPACGSGQSRTLVRRSFRSGGLEVFLREYYGGRLPTDWLDGAEYRLDECTDCTLLFQRHIGGPELMQGLYDTLLNADHGPDDEISRAALAHPLQSRDGHELLAAGQFLGRPVRGLRVFDYGFGWGLWLRVALRLGCEAFGFELSEQRCAFARAEGVRISDPLAWAALGVDFLNSDQTFEHLPAPLCDARQLATALRPGGVMKIAVPLAPDLARLRDLSRSDRPEVWRAANPVHPLEHINCYTPRALEVMAGRAGLKPVSIPLRAHFAFARTADAVDVMAPRAAAKAFLRPAYHRFSKRNLYRWFVK